MSSSEVLQGLGLIIYNLSDGRIFTVQELQRKEELEKIPGEKDWSFPLETIEPGDDDPKTILRLLLEEVDAADVLRISNPKLFCWERRILGGRALATVYTAFYLGGPTNVRGSRAGTEIEPLGFQRPQDIIARARGGVAEIIEAFVESNSRLYNPSLREDPELQERRVVGL